MSAQQIKPHDRDIPVYTLDLNPNSGFPFWIGKNRFSEHANLHKHQYIQINYVIKGKGFHCIGGELSPLEVGDIFVMPPYTAHRIIPLNPGQLIEVMEIEFVPEFLNEQFQELDKARFLFDFSYIAPFLVCESDVRSRLSLTGSKQVLINDIVFRLYDEYQQRKPLFEHAFKAQLLFLLVELNRTFTEDIENSDNKAVFLKHRTAIEKALKHIDDNYTDDLKVEDIAKIAMMSQSYFCYFFKTLVGKTFTQHLIEKRLNYAKELLMSTELSVTDIAVKSGFNNVSHFIRTFKSGIALSPIQYRKLSRRV